ncbi:MAG: AbrB family transcriptional regulator [Alphaproteobacteria bacterium]
MRPRQFFAQHVTPLALALVPGVLGALAFRALTLPLPWMLGPVCVVTLLALAGAKVRVQYVLREPMVVLIGVMLGSSFTPHALQDAREYAVSMSMLALYVVFTVGLLILYFRKIGGYDFATCYFASIPGGLMEMVVMGGQMGGDDRKIFLAHGTRILLVVLAVPIWFRVVEGYVPGSGLGVGANSVPLADFAWLDGAILAACGVIGFFAGKAVRLPAYRFTGPLILSAVAHLAGLTASKPPAELIVLAQIVLGASLGCRYVGVRLREIAGALKIAFGSAVLLMACAAIFSYGIHFVTGFKSEALLLSLSPGGLVEMTLIALALGIDVAFVTIHHLVRIVLSVVVAPLTFKPLERLSNRLETKGNQPP